MADKYELKAIISASATSMFSTLKQVQSMSKTTRKYLTDVAGSASALSGKIGLPFTALSGVLAGFSLVAIKNAVIGFTDMAEQVQVASFRTGIAVEQIQRMKYVAEQSAVEFDSFQSSVGKLNMNIGKAASGKGKDAAALFKKLGISLRDSNGQLKSGMDILPQLSDAFVRNENPVIRARMGMALFGKSWQEIIPLLMEGSANIDENMSRFGKLKSIISPEDIKAAKELGDKFRDLDIVSKGFQNTIASQLVPVLSPMIEDFIQWAAANRKVIASGVKEYVKSFIETVRSIDWKGVIESAKSFISTIKDIVQFVGGAKNALIGLVIIMNLQTIMAFVNLTASVWRLGAAFVTFAVTSGSTMIPALVRMSAYLIGMAASSIPAAIAAVGRLGASMTLAAGGASALLGVLGQIGLVAAAGYGGYQIGSWLNDNVINPGVQKLTGQKDASLGTWIYDKTHPDIAGGGQIKASGSIDININGAPSGTRVEQIKKSGDVPIRTNVGTRSFVAAI